MSQEAFHPKFCPPVHEVRIGLVRAAIWANRGKDATRYVVTFERRYRHGEEWNTATSFGPEDLLTLAKVADEAHSWITRQGPAKRGGVSPPERRLPKVG